MREPKNIKNNTVITDNLKCSSQRTRSCNMEPGDIRITREFERQRESRANICRYLEQIKWNLSHGNYVGNEMFVVENTLKGLATKEMPELTDDEVSWLVVGKWFLDSYRDAVNS